MCEDKQDSFWTKKADSLSSINCFRMLRIITLLPVCYSVIKYTNIYSLWLPTVYALLVISHAISIRSNSNYTSRLHDNLAAITFRSQFI